MKGETREDAKKEHKRCEIREEMCDKNGIGRENNNIKMRMYKRKNIL